MENYAAIIEDIMDKLERGLEHPNEAKSMLVSVAMILNNAGITVESARDLIDDHDDEDYGFDDAE